MTAKTSAVRFLTGEGHDHLGRVLEEVLAFDDKTLEQSHDYIQWVFPLPEASRFNLDAPVLTAEALAELRASDEARTNLRRARDRMLAFYRANDHWLTAFDHNHLRITRIIRCLSLALGEDEAQHFHHEVKALVAAAGNPVNAESIGYWQEAVG
jgi:hypothetical protein